MAAENDINGQPMQLREVFSAGSVSEEEAMEGDEPRSPDSRFICLSDPHGKAIDLDCGLGGPQVPGMHWGCRGLLVVNIGGWSHDVFQARPIPANVSGQGCKQARQSVVSLGFLCLVRPVAYPQKRCNHRDTFHGACWGLAAGTG
ncbi:hypothetical protein PGT21_022562 [Puccinia graminis f. sp. tritici]|uniref:Uncharacterized protein n=1 Tax=Puccinia graminis f. sp. tritici TaxID=56615 RepID=A0A5B0LRG1_PUCGR|nr:hypothetical protein PGTUg99_014329 [Puccinia graminis f. sp. tritici]KAA1071908.1 hypothetical protein PGT21_022562 [Puccinia graminis f. sp. tritici]